MSKNKDIFSTYSEDSSAERTAMPTGSQPAYRAPSTAGTKSDIYATFTSSEDEDEYDESLGLQPGDLLGGNFELTEVVGRGAMGEVWLARELVKGEYSRDVVVKIVPKDIQNAKVEIERVRATFDTIQELQHSHICPVYYLGSDDRFGYFLVMKHIVGRNLSDYVKDYRKRNKKQPTLDDLLPMLAQFASALDYAHSKGVIHRDVKPQNLFHSPKDGAQLIDFGLAESVKTDDDDDTSSAVSGTIVYMSPEQLQGEHQDKHSDQYSFAATVYELLTGQPPFVASTYDLLLDRILYDQVMPFGSVADSVNDALDRALSKERENRFESCTEFVEALRESAGVVPEKRRAASKTSGLVDPEVISLMKRAHLFLEDSDWAQANAYFERVLDKDAEYAPAYIGKLCTDLKVQHEEMLGDREKPISGHKHFQKAVRFAKNGYKAQIEGYDEKIRERLRQEQYDRLIQAKHGASSEHEYQGLAAQFREMEGYRDTAALAEECANQYSTLKEQREERERQEWERRQRENEERERREAEERERKLQERYDRLVREKATASTEEDHRNLAQQFRDMPVGYKDTTELAEKCDNLAIRACYKRLAEEVNEIKKSPSVGGWKRLAAAFREMDGYKNTAELAKKCENMALEFRYKQLWVSIKEDLPEGGWRSLAEQFREMNGYKNTAKLAENCDKKHRQLKEQRENAERIERERKETEERTANQFNYFKTLKKSAQFGGRARRQEYWRFSLINFGIMSVFWIPFAIAVNTVPDARITVILSFPVVLFGFFIFVSSLSLTVRRLHDSGFSGWTILVIFIPYVGYLILLIILCLDSESGSNKYGPYPK